MSGQDEDLPEQFGREERAEIIREAGDGELIGTGEQHAFPPVRYEDL